MIASAALLDPQIAHLAVIAERLETIAEALTRPPAPIPPTPNGNGTTAPRRSRTQTNAPTATATRRGRSSTCTNLRAEIDAQLRKLQQP